MAEITSENRWSPRITAYLTVGIALTLASVALWGVTGSSSHETHTLMETVAVILAAIVGVVALVRFYSKKNNAILFIGAGCLGAAFLDTYHAIVTADFFAYLMPSDLPRLSTWSWIASRQLLGTMLCLSWFAWLLQQRLEASSIIKARTIYVVTAILTIACFLFFTLVPLPVAYYQGTIFHRPEEFVPALFFAVALVGYLRKGGWREDAFEHWLVLALIVSLFTQIAFMPFSGELFDFEFNAAHLLKIISYLCVLVGLLISLYETLHEAENTAFRFQTMLTNTIDGIITINEQGTIQEFNLAAEKIFGYPATEIIGRNVRMLMPEPDRGQHDQYLNNYFTTGHKKIIGIGREVVGLRKDGTTFPLDLGITEVRVANTRTFIGSTRDITRLKQAEQKIVERSTQLEEANAELDAFAYSVSHDLRAPLRALGGFSEALVEDYGDQLDGEAHGYLNRISKASQRMGQMIDDILTLSRTIRVEITMEPVSLSTIAESILLQHREAEPDRDVSVMVAPGVTVHGDKRILEIVLRNLLHNAWKFSSNKAQSRIEFDSVVMDGERVFFVRDNGAGFNMAYADKLFGIFQRLHSKSEFDGNGIGLATVARLLRRHGGRIWAESAENEGATFYFTVGIQNKGRNI